MNYVIVLETTAEELQDAVNVRIANGWVPVGGVSISISCDTEGVIHREYAQAMTLTEAVN